MTTTIPSSTTPSFCRTRPPRSGARAQTLKAAASPSLQFRKTCRRSSALASILKVTALSLSLMLVPAQSSSAQAAEPSPQHELPGDSLFHLDLPLLDHNAVSSRLADFRGTPFLITLVYASCPSACPMLIQDMKRIERALPEELRKELAVLVVSFDPEADTPEALMALAKRQKVDLSRWKLASAPAVEVAELAAVLGVNYRKVEGGHWAHSSVISVVDSQGVVRGRYEGYLKSVDEAVETVRSVLEEAQKQK